MAAEEGGFKRISNRKRAELRDNLTQILDQESPRQESPLTMEEEKEEEDPEAANTRFRKLDRRIRWVAFLFHTTDLWEDILATVYGLKFNIDSVEIIQARQKIMDNVKQYKHKMLGRLKACVLVFTLYTESPLNSV